MDKVNESILSETILEDMKENRIDHMTYLEFWIPMLRKRLWKQ